jgi:hypothetical protein
MKVLVNIRGCNGAGKSTIPMSMLDDPDLEVYDSKKGWSLTLFPSYGWLALGKYKTKTGGMDTISTKAQKFEALEYAWTEYPDFDIIMEGVIDSTIRSTYIDLFTDYENRVLAGEITPPRKIIVLNFLPPVEVCVQRVLERNGGVPVKAEQIESKWKTVMRNVQYFREAGITTLKYDTSKIPRELMLDKFFQIVDKYRGE